LKNTILSSDFFKILFLRTFITYINVLFATSISGEVEVAKEKKKQKEKAPAGGKWGEESQR